MSYIDGFVTPVPAANKEAYIAHSKEMLPVLKKLGAIRMVECWGDDVSEGKVTDFRRAVDAKHIPGFIVRHHKVGNGVENLDPVPVGPLHACKKAAILKRN